MKKLFGILMVVACAVTVLALDDANNYTFNGELRLDKGGILDIGKGTLKIDSTAVTATAAQLNSAASGAVPLANTKVFIGSAGGVATAQTISGDGTLSAAGTLTLAARSVTGAKLPIATAGQILVGQTDSNALVKTMSGDATVDANGAIAIGAGVIVNADVATNAAIVRSKLSLGGFTGTFDFLKPDSTTGTVMCADGVITNTP